MPRFEITFQATSAKASMFFATPTRQRHDWPQCLVRSAGSAGPLSACSCFPYELVGRNPALSNDW